MTSPIRLFLLRHAEVEVRYQRVFGGRIDMDLSPQGHEQAAALARYLRQKPLDAIYASPMKRVQQTLNVFTPHSQHTPVILPELREVDFGDWTGLGWDQVHTQYNVSAFHWLDRLEQAAIPNAECSREFRARIERSLQMMVQGHGGQNVAVFCHGGVIRMMLAVLLALPLSKMAAFEIEYASLTQVDHHPHKTEVQLLNFTPWRDLA